MKQSPMQEITPVGNRKYPGRGHWKMALAAVLLVGMLWALYASWGSLQPSMVGAAVTVAGTICCCTLAGVLARRYIMAGTLFMLPPVVLLALTGPVRPWVGMQGWLNGLIGRWNEAHDGGAALFAVAATERDAAAFTLFAAMVCSYLVYWVIRHRLVMVEGLCCVGWIALLLVGQCYEPMPCALLLAALLCTAMYAPHTRISHQMALHSALLTAGLCLCAAILPRGEMPQIRTLRTDAEQAVHDLRYGEDTLPQGNLYKAADLQSAEGIQLTVQSAQEKNLYLRAYVGGQYADGQWLPLADSAYGGSNAGLLDWLQARGFDPLTQSATYYSLCTDAPEENRLQVTVRQATRYYYYAPESLSQTSRTSRDQKDGTLLTTGLWGSDSYTMAERSDSRPAELTVAQGWVADPRTDEQQAYSEAEAVYRSFVYDNYTSLDEASYALMDRMFWQDYTSDSDGIYSAISRVRAVLRREVLYTDTPEAAPEGTDPIAYFLTDSHQGNAALYAAATVQALRAHGIPARYAEGYYIPSYSLAGNGKAEISAKNAHAWAEVYFDGVGWLPLDTVPGYYYEAVALQQMVGQPNAVHKTAALQENDTDAAQITTNGPEKQLPEPLQTVVRSVPYVLLGLAAVIVLLVVFAFAVLEPARAIRIRMAVRRYERADAEGRAELLEQHLFRMLQRRGIETTLGWQTQQTDAALAEKFAPVQPGEYARVCELIERSVYGGMPPDAREERAMRSFLQKLARCDKSGTVPERLRDRYFAPV